jgi:hypothetical protein
MVRCSREAKKRRNDIPIRLAAAGNKSMWRCFPVILADGGRAAVRTVVVMTSEAVEPAFTVTGTQAAPVCKPVHVSGNDALPTSVTI